MEFYIEKVENFSEELTNDINNLLVQLNETAVPLKNQDIKDMIASSVNNFFVAKESENKKIVGMISLIILRTAFAKKAFIEDVVVDSKYRGKGIGTKLISFAIDAARKKGVTYIDLTSNPKRTVANKLYEHLGFEKRDTNVYRIKL